MSSHILVVGFVTACSLGWFDSSGRVYFLSFSSCVSFLCLFRISGNFGEILDVNEWPGEIVSLSYGFEPRGFCWKTCERIKISYGLFNNWGFIHIVYCFWCVFGHEC